MCDCKTKRIVTRYVIVDVNTNKVLDDALGYGYKTKTKAFKSYLHKNPSQEKLKKDEAIWEWLSTVPNFVGRIREKCHTDYRRNTNAGIRYIEKVLIRMNLREQCPFSATELYWRLR